MTVLAADKFMESLGVEAYRVGGSVRDEVLGIRPKDADYMVRGLTLSELRDVLNDPANNPGYIKVSKLKLRDGSTVGYRVAGRDIGTIEVVLPRREQARRARRGENKHRAFDIVVDPSLSLEEDAKRRDFTFNALYKRIDEKLWDQFPVIIDATEHGVDDLKHRMVRTTHSDSFRDDPLRTLRALRFVSRMGYDLAQTTQHEMIRYADSVTGLAASGFASGTVLSELSKILMGDDAVKALRLARDTGVLGALLPELAPMIGFDQGSRYHDLTTDEHTFKALETAVHVDAPLRVRMALLFHDSGKPDSAWIGKDGRKHYYAKKIPTIGWTEDHEVVSERLWQEAASRLGVDNKLRNDVSVLVREHMVTPGSKIKRSKVNRMRIAMGDSLLRDLLMHRVCDISGKGSAKVSTAALARIGDMEAIRQESVTAGVPISVGDLKVNGNDAMQAGLKGKEIGDALHAILDEVACQPDERRMSREYQLAKLSEASN